MMPPLDVMATDSKIAGNGLEPVCNAHQRADNVGDHVQDEHRHGLFHNFRRQGAPAHVIVGTTTRAESGASVSFTFDTMDLKMMPMRENLMPPAVEPKHRQRP